MPLIGHRLPKFKSNSSIPKRVRQGVTLDATVNDGVTQARNDRNGVTRNGLPYGGADGPSADLFLAEAAE